MRSNHKHSIPSCELCGGQSTLYCPSDSAFLCLSCDSNVHHANFLVSRHLRHPLCPSCHSISSSSSSSSSLFPLCPTCSLPFAPSSSSSSACISTTPTQSSVAVVPRQKKTISSVPEEVTSVRATCRNPNPGATTLDAEAEAVFVIWCKRMGLESYAAAGIIPRASRVLGVCRGRLKTLPLRVAAAASFWLGMRMEGSSTWQSLKRVEEVSGVPAKLILAGEARVARALRAAQLQQVSRIDLREGWAEC